MNAPIELLYMAAGPAPDLGTSAWGPLVVHPAATLEEVNQALGRHAFDALVLRCADAASCAALLAWETLPQVVLDTAVLVLMAEPEPADALRLARLGVQDVVPLRDAGAMALARLVRLAVERKRLERDARRAYATDLATGLPNHAQLMEHMSHLLALREREPAAMALLALRIEGIASTAARLGAESANVLRRKVAVRLRAGLRASDVVAAIGADSYAVLLAWLDSAEDGARVADKLAAALQRPFSVAGQDAAVALRIGVAQYPLHGKDAAALLQRALHLADSAPLHGRSGLSRRSGGTAANDD